MRSGFKVGRIIGINIPVRILVYDYGMRGDERAFPVLEQDHFVGMVYTKNLRKIDHADWSTTTVRQVMVPETEKGNAPDPGCAEWRTDWYVAQERHPALAAGSFGDDEQLKASEWKGDQTCLM